ncbi:MAG TPA: SGNH/GDSL hydrolase family protein, partial [Planctomycetota bacterium]|nr:SGNH/GDSL hydrolase family protein [Planctomycetota bacterium]
MRSANEPVPPKFDRSDDAPATAGRRAGTGARIALLAGSTLACALAVEGAWRVWWTNGFGPNTNPHYVEHDDELGWVYRRGAVARHRTADYDVTIRIDETGERDLERGPQPPGAPIAVIGDSLAFGWGVAGAETFASRLVTLVGRPVRNLAVSGYGTDQELLCLHRASASMRPSIGVVVVCGNDLWEILHDEMYGKGKPRFVMRSGALVIENVPVRRSLLERISFFYRSVHRHWSEARQVAAESIDEPRAQSIVGRLLREMARDLGRVGAPLVVVHEALPWVAEKTRGEPGVHVLDVAETLAVRARERPTVFAGDLHWNATGH